MTANPNLAADQKSLGKQGAIIDVNTFVTPTNPQGGDSTVSQHDKQSIRRIQYDQKSHLRRASQ